MSFSSLTLVPVEGGLANPHQDVHCLHLHDGQREEKGGGGGEEEEEQQRGEEHQQCSAQQQQHQPELERRTENPRNSTRNQCNG